jgi:hypothetical protein
LLKIKIITGQNEGEATQTVTVTKVDAYNKLQEATT